MSVYIESVLLDNFFITLLIAKLSYRALSVTRGGWRQAAAAAIGTAVAVCYPFFRIHAGFLFLIKIALALLLSLILFYKKSKLWQGSGVFLAITFAFGGVLFGIGYLIYADAIYALTVPIGNLPIGVLIAGILAAFFFIKKIVAKVKRLRDASDWLGKAEFDILGKNFSFAAFLDSGNRLYDPKTGLPVIVLSRSATLAVLGDEGFVAVIAGKADTVFRDARTIPYTTANAKNSRLLIVKPDEIRFFFGQSKHILKEVVLGLSFADFTDCVDYEVLMHPALFGEFPHCECKNKRSVPV